MIGLNDLNLPISEILIEVEESMKPAALACALDNLGFLHNPINYREMRLKFYFAGKYIMNKFEHFKDKSLMQIMKEHGEEIRDHIASLYSEY